MDPVGQILLIIAGLLLLGAAGEFIFSRTGIPDVIWLVCAGILLGPVFAIISAEALQSSVPFIGAMSLTVILSGGAYRLQFREVASVAPRGLVLGLLAFVFSVAGICIFLWLATEIGVVVPASPLVWITIGAIVGGTSALVVMPTMAAGTVDSKVARILDVESSATDALCVVIVMVLIDLIVSGSANLSRAFISLGRDIGIGTAMGVITAALLVPFVPSLRDKAHGYTVFLAAMLVLYALTKEVEGNGAVAVLVSSMILGNAGTLVPRLVPGALSEAFVAGEITRVVQTQMSFLIKSFFFVLIGLMFPTTPRLIVLGAVAAMFLLLFRIPAVTLAVRGMGVTRKQFWMLVVAIPRGLAAGVLSTLPLHFGVPNAENLSPAVFALIVFSILFFSLGFVVVGRMHADGERPS